MKAADLRKAILQAAVQGKLVPQNKNDEPVSELLKRIQAEKAVLIKEGRLKKEKPLPPITEDEIPYDLPEGWVWCHFIEVSTISSNLVSPELYQDFLHLAPDNIVKGTGYLLKCRTVREDHVRSNNHMFRKGQIIYSKIRPALKKAVIAPFDGLCSADMYPLYVYICTDYFLWFLLSDFFTVQVIKNDTRVKMPKTNQDELVRVIVPVPPIDEQRRIASKVTQLMTMCDEFEAAEKELDVLEEHFFDYLPKSILQAAVQGKLVPQDKNDESASELLKRIQAEKDALIKDGKLKKEKPLPPILEDDTPYDLPDGWAWCRLSEIAHSVCGKENEIKATEVAPDGNYPVVSQGKNLIDGYSNAVEQVFRVNVPVVMFGDHTKNVKYIDFNFVIGADGTKFLEPICINPKYFYFLILNATNTMASRGYARHFKLLNSCIFPLPPLVEQQRIVAKMNELMAMCDELMHVADQPIDNSKIIPLSVVKAAAEPIAMAARGDAENLSAQAKQAIEDLFGEDE